MKKWFKNNWFKLIAIVFLLGTFGSWPYAYYQILRWVVCAVAVYSSYFAYQLKKISWAWIFGIIAVLFNPILPIYFTKEIWQLVDIIVAVIFFVSLFILKDKKIHKKNRKEHN